VNFTEADTQLEKMLTAVVSLQREVNRLKVDIRAARRELKKGIITDAHVEPQHRPDRRRIPGKTPKRPRRDRAHTVATAATPIQAGVDHPRRER